MDERPDVTEGVEGYHYCPRCKGDGRLTLTIFPQCERCQNMHSPHKLTMPHWSDDGEAVNEKTR